MSQDKLIIEEFACWGCRACEVACKQEHNPFSFKAFHPNGTQAAKFLSVWEDGPKILDGKLHYMFRVSVCRHCDNPVCVKACPEAAMTKDAKTGIVMHDQEKCTGCNAGPAGTRSEKERTSSCKADCPAHNDIQGYVGLAAKGEYRNAIALLKETSPFPSVCGRVCHHPCESNCNRSQVDEPLAIRQIERFLADRDFSEGKPYAPPVSEPKGQKAAIIGSGPAGLTAAYFLARDGYEVTVFEKLPVAGGMMAVGIPEYRLPRDVLSREIKVILDMGVEIKTGVTFGKDITLSDLKKNGYRSVFLATGLHGNNRLDVENEDLKGVLMGVDFLRDVALGATVAVGKRVIVVGGGNVAIDVALTSIRRGAHEVTVVCLEERDEMPAWKHEIEEAMEEGVRFLCGFGPRRFLAQDGRLCGVEFKRCTSLFDHTGAFHPAYDASDLKSMEADTVIVAIGQAPDLSFLQNQKIIVGPGGRLQADPVTLETPIRGVFAGGDAYYGPRSVVEAIGSGREAAISMDRTMRGLSLTADRDRKWAVVREPHKEKHDPSRRAQAIRLDPKKRAGGFAEVRLGFSEETTVQEAGRCLSCGCSCIQACPYDAIAFDEESGKAKKCDLCYERVRNGLYPACADNVCLARCIYFGPPSEIEQRILEKRRMRGGWGETIPKSIKR